MGDVSSHLGRLHRAGVPWRQNRHPPADWRGIVTAAPFPRHRCRGTVTAVVYPRSPEGTATA
jgi:hypothetical protein